MPTKKKIAPKYPKYNILVLKGKTWVVRTTIDRVNRADGTSRPIKDANDAIRYGYGIYGTRPRQGQATSKSGKKFRAEAVA